MAVETGGTSETSLKRKATAEYFYFEIEGHYECGELLTKPSGKRQSKSARQKAALHINDKIEPGFWSWTDQGPKRLNISVREGPCEEKRDALMAKIEPRHSNLKEKFDAAKAGQDPKLRTQSFQRILEAIGLADENNRSSNLTLEQDVLFTCHAEIFERKIRDGIATLQSASPEEQRSLFCRVVDYRANPSKSLCEIFDEDVAHTTSRNAKAQWLPKFSASVATVVARAHDAQFSESGIRDKEREIVRKSKLAHIVHQTINELISARQVTNGSEGPIPGPVVGVNALIICSALNENPCLFFEATRQIHTDSIPAFARHLARLLIDIDWSNLPATISVAFPLFLICWAMRKPFSEVCDILGLPNLARLSLDVTAQLDDAEKRWRIATQNWERMTRAEIEVATTQLGQDVQISLGDLRRLCLDQSDAELMTAEVRPSENSVPDHDSSSQNVECAGEAGSVASDEGSLFLPFQSSVDSGYVSNVGSQQMHGSTLAAPLSGAFVVPSASSSRSNVQRDPAAAGVVQNLSREATSLSLADPAPGASVRMNTMPDASAHDQLLSYQSVRGLDALASAASQACPSHHDGGSGYSGSAISPQFSVATSAMPIPTRGSETILADPSMTWSGGSAAENAAHAGDSGGEWTGAAAGQKRPQVEDSPTSKRHRPSAEETTERLDTSEASNADPEFSASTSHAAPQGDVARRAVSGIADPVQHQTLEEFMQEYGLSSEDWNSMYNPFSATSATACDSWEGMFDGIPATSTMAHVDIPISDELLDVHFSENAASLPTFLSEPQPSGTVPPAEETET